VLVITAPRGNPAAQQSYTESVENKMNKVMDPATWDRDRDSRKKEDATYFDDRMDLRRRDPFFDDDREMQRKDSFFEDSKRDFEQRKKDFFGDFKKDSIFSDNRRDSAFDDMRRDSSFGTSLTTNSRQGGGFENIEAGDSKIVYEDDMYKILINVEKYQPEELMIKTVDTNVIVEAKHEEKTSDGRSYSTQSFNQSFSLPSGVNPESVTSSLSKSGILTISAPLPKSLKLNNGERLIPIKHN